MKRYIFIHPTKCGGTAVKSFFMKVYPYHTIDINIMGDSPPVVPCHQTVCKDYDNPVIIIREPVDRFISMFKYWKSGALTFVDWSNTSQKRIRGEGFIEKYKNYTIKDFIKLLKAKDSSLYIKFTFRLHYESYLYWIKPRDYSKTIVIKYCEDLNSKLPEILEALEIQSVNKSMEKINISNNSETITLDEEDLKYIKTVYKYDFELWDNINNNPALFKRVV